MKDKKNDWGQALPLAVYKQIITSKHLKGTKKLISKDGISSCKTIKTPK